MLKRGETHETGVEALWTLLLLFLIGFLLLFSFLSAVLYHFSLISAAAFHIINDAAAYVGMLISGALFGFLIRKKALPQALLMSVILMICRCLSPEGSAGYPDPCHLSRHAVLPSAVLDLTHDPHSS